MYIKEFAFAAIQIPFLLMSIPNGELGMYVQPLPMQPLVSEAPRERYNTPVATDQAKLRLPQVLDRQQQQHQTLAGLRHLLQTLLQLKSLRLRLGRSLPTPTATHEAPRMAPVT